MTYCQQLPDGDGFRCTMCGWMYHKLATRQCPKSPEGRAGKLIAITHAISSQRENNMNWHMYHPRAAVDLAKYIEICLDCDDHNGNTCVRRGMDQRKSCQWLQSLGCVGFRECPNWK